MPPVRTRTDSSNSASPNAETPYNIPARTSPVRGITFAPNVAAETYNELPDLIVPPESTLFPSANVPESPRKPSHSKKKPDDWIPRPPNAFILFRSEVTPSPSCMFYDPIQRQMVEQFIKSQHVPGDVEANHGNLSKIIGLCWRNLPFEERDVWECKARIAMAEHKAKYPNYRFRPNQRDPNTVKRRVKEPPVPPDEKRCEEIATLLVEGMKGDELSDAVKALDATRPPEVITPRFDDPVTATVFRRSSSAPVPEADAGKTKFVKPSTPTRASRATRAKKPRAASSSPTKKRSPRFVSMAAPAPPSSSPAPSFNSESEDSTPQPVPYAPYSSQDSVLDQSGHSLAEPGDHDHDAFLNPFEQGQGQEQYALPDQFNPFESNSPDSAYPTDWSFPESASPSFYPTEPESPSSPDSPYLEHTPSSSYPVSPYLEHHPAPYLDSRLPAPVPRACGELSSALTHLEFAAINRSYAYSEFNGAELASYLDKFGQYATVGLYAQYSPADTVTVGAELQSLHDYTHAVQELKPLRLPCEDSDEMHHRPAAY